MIKILVIGLAAFLLFVIQLGIYRRMWNRHLGVSLEFVQSDIFEGETGELLEVIENRKKLPLPMLKVKFQTSRHLLFSDMEGSRTTDQYYRNDIFQIGGGERITRTLTFTGGKRGYYKIRGIDIIGADLFLTTEMRESRKTDRYVYVYPKPYDSNEFSLSLQQLNGEILTKRHLLEDPFEYRGIREYQPYDDMRSINWKATAKTENLMVNQKNYTALQSVRIFFNIEDIGIWKEAESVEASLQIVAGLAEYYLKQGIRVACYGNGADVISGEPVQVEAGGGSGQMERIYKALAGIDTDRPVVSFSDVFRQRLMQEMRGTMTFFVAPNAYEDFVELISEYQAAGQDYVWYFPSLNEEEPKLPTGLNRHIRILHLRG